MPMNDIKFSTYVEWVTRSMTHQITPCPLPSLWQARQGIVFAKLGGLHPGGAGAERRVAPRPIHPTSPATRQAVDEVP